MKKYFLSIVFIMSLSVWVLYLVFYSGCGPNNLGLAPIIGGAGTTNSQLPVFSVGTYKMNTLSSSVKPEVSFGYFNYTTKPFAFINLNPTNNVLIPINSSVNFNNQGNKVLVLGTAFAGGDTNATSERDIFWVGKILDPNNQSNWVNTVTVGGKNYIVVKGTNFIARYSYQLNAFDSTFDSMVVKKTDNISNYGLIDFQDINQDFKSIAFLRYSSNANFYGVLVGKNVAFSCDSAVSSGNDFKNLYGISGAPTTSDYVWEDSIPFDRGAGVVIGHLIDENPTSGKIRTFNEATNWSSDIGISGFDRPFYSSDYITFFNDNSLFKVASIVGNNMIVNYVNTPPNQNQFDINKIEAVNISSVSTNVVFYGVTVLRSPGDTDSNYNVSFIAVGYDFNANFPIILKFTRTGNRDNNPAPPFNSNYNLNRIDLSALGLNQDVVFLDVNNVLISNTNYVYVVGLDLSNCLIKPYPNGTLPPLTKSLIFPASAPFTTTNNDVINTLNNMRGILLYSNDGGNTFRLIGAPFITP